MYAYTFGLHLLISGCIYWLWVFLVCIYDFKCALNTCLKQWIPTKKIRFRKCCHLGTTDRLLYAQFANIHASRQKIRHTTHAMGQSIGITSSTLFDKWRKQNCQRTHSRPFQRSWNDRLLFELSHTIQVDGPRRAHSLSNQSFGTQLYANVSNEFQPLPTGTKTWRTRQPKKSIVNRTKFNQFDNQLNELQPGGRFFVRRWIGYGQSKFVKNWRTHTDEIRQFCIIVAVNERGVWLWTQISGSS